MSNWIAIYHTLPSHPKMRKIHRATNASSVQETIGRLVCVWMLADAHSDNGVLVGCLEDIDDAAECEGFGEAMIAVGWLQVIDEDTIEFTNFGDHNGQTAKTRLKNAERQRVHRAKNRGVTQESRPSNDTVTPERDNAVTTEQNRTEQNNPERERAGERAGFQDWHPIARAVFDDPESGETLDRFWEKYKPRDEDSDRSMQVVAMFLTRHPKALKVGWTIPKLVELAEAVDTHEHLTTAQALIEIDLLTKLSSEGKTKMQIPQVDELAVVLTKCERQNLSRKRLDASVGTDHDDQRILNYASSLNDGKRKTLLAGTREAMRFTQTGEQDVALFWDSRREGNPLRIDWLGQDAGALWLRAQAAKYLGNRKAAKKETA